MASPQTPLAKSLRIAVLLEEVQLADIIPIDMLANLSASYLAKAIELDPSFSRYAPHAPQMEFFFLATTLEAAPFTNGLKYVPTHTYDTCPRDLDMVFIGGPFFTHRPAEAKKFIQEAWETTKLWMTTCVGSVWLAHAGVLDGLRATTNRGLMGAARAVAPGVKWVEERWVVEMDGEREIWTSGGAGAGVDMMAEFLQQRLDKEFVVTMALEGLEFLPSRSRGKVYGADEDASSS
ncbi:hypothetical protein OQA88_5445 [Cercophora sp. LCS_1]